MQQRGVTDVYFHEADDHTPPAVSCEGQDTMIVALVVLQIKCYCCNIGREEKEYWVFLFVDTDYYFKDYLYTVFTLYMYVLLE